MLDQKFLENEYKKDFYAKNTNYVALIISIGFVLTCFIILGLILWVNPVGQFTLQLEDF